MTNAQIEAGTLTANLQDRIVSGLLLPFGEVGNTNLGRFSVDPGVITVPADVTVLAANTDHKRENPVARFMTAVETSAGIVASFSIGKNPEGDELLAEIADTKNPKARRKLSAEIADVVIQSGKALGGKLFGAGFVAAGAFPSATLMAADVGELEDDTETPDGTQSTEPTETVEKTTDEFTDEAGKTWKRTTTTKTVIDGEKTTITTTAVIEEPPTDEAPNEEEEPPVAVPNTLTAAKGGTSTVEVKDRPIDLPSVYAAIAAMKSHSASAEQNTLLAALADITISGAGALPAAGVLQQSWVGQVWQGKTYERQYINLAKLGTDITAAGKKGFKMFRGTAGAPVDRLGGDWTGNKTPIPTGQAFTSTLGSTLDRYAVGADIAREFYDLPGGAEVVEAFIRFLNEDYAEWSDEKALALIIATAGAAIAPKSYPTEYGGSIGQLIQGILAVKRAKDTPSYAIVNATAYEELLYTPKDKIPEYVSLQFSTELTGTVDAGKITVVEAPDSWFTTIEADTPAVLVGAKNAIEFDELSSTPLQVDALEIAKGGVDRAVHGYLQKFVVRPEAVVLVGETETP